MALYVCCVGVHILTWNINPPVNTKSTHYPISILSIGLTQQPRYQKTIKCLVSRHWDVWVNIKPFSSYKLNILRKSTFWFCLCLYSIPTHIYIFLLSKAGHLMRIRIWLSGGSNPDSVLSKDLFPYTVLSHVENKTSVQYSQVPKYYFYWWFHVKKYCLL